MSTTDRVEVCRKPCLCETGEVIINFCEPDHPWPTASKWFETSLTCANCSAEYDLIDQDNQYVFVRKSDVKKREALHSEQSRRSKELLKAPETRVLLEDLKLKLNRQPSMAACHRFLRAHDLVHNSYSTFRKEWEGGDNWVKRHVRAYNLDRVLELLEKKNLTISNELSEMKALYEEYDAPLPIVGDPLFDTSSYL